MNRVWIVTCIFVLEWSGTVAATGQEKSESKPRDGKSTEKSTDKEKSGTKTADDTGYLEPAVEGAAMREARIDAIRREFPAFSGLRFTPADHARVTQWERMSSEERQEFESFLSCFFPSVWSELKGLRKENRAHYDDKMSHLAQDLAPLIDRLVDKKDYTILQIKERQLTYELQKLQGEYVNATGAEEKRRLELEMADLLGQRIDARRKKIKMDVERLEPRIRALNEMAEDLEVNREALIQRDLETWLNPTGKPADGRDAAVRKNKEDN